LPQCGNHLAADTLTGRPDTTKGSNFGITETVDGGSGRLQCCGA